MGLSINTNIAALNSYRNLTNTQNDLSKSLEKLSSGLRINRAADDAAGLAISEDLRAQIGGTKQAVRNAQDGISVVQTAEGALTETHSILQRMRTLSVQASNDGGLSDTAKGNIKDEMDQLKTELTRISETTQFNGTKLLDGKYSGVFQVGANNSAQDKITVDVKTASGQGLGAVGLGVDGLDVTAVASNATAATLTTAASAGVSAVLTVDSAVDYSDDDVTKWTALNGTVSVGSKSLDLSSIDYSGVTTSAAAEAKLQAALDSTFGTNALVADGTTGTAGIVITGTDPGATATAAESAAVEPKFTQASGATEAIDLIDSAITEVSKVRSGLGAVQNRFDHTINNLNVAVENLSASESRIRDTDMASEMVSFTRSQILSQAGTAMLAQAKSLPQSVLQLLQ
ncbi:flagellin N-terminal helical domain-containing protein [Cellulomonas soli]|uniref:Flagellin n=1 Tax=Cellulomonas soli TaxID=931535 RepID=A0A512PEP7_9CELL|nr:flagellin [Cellulomonas soli]NYI59528.1 flagellin [Cellulomonas soli]GEP69680.1 flagellin [Cellulomonas soli]